MIIIRFWFMQIIRRYFLQFLKSVLNSLIDVVEMNSKWVKLFSLFNVLKNDLISKESSVKNLTIGFQQDLSFFIIGLICYKSWQRWALFKGLLKNNLEISNL